MRTGRKPKDDVDLREPMIVIHSAGKNYHFECAARLRLRGGMMSAKHYALCASCGCTFGSTRRMAKDQMIRMTGGGK